MKNKSKKHSKSALQNSYDHAIAIMRKHSKSFYAAFSSLPRERFLGIAAIYAFCRTVDDLVDSDQGKDSKGAIESELSQLSSQVLELTSGKPVQNPYKWWLAFQDTVQKFNISAEGFLMQIKGQKMDLSFKDIQSLNQLIDYSRHVAGSVGRMILPILVMDSIHIVDEDMLLSAEKLGIAMQITNILRDIGEDLKVLDRVYLPREVLEEFSLNKVKLHELYAYYESKMDHSSVEAKDMKNFKQAWEFFAHISETYYEEFIENLEKLDTQARLPVYASILIYRAILDEVRSNQYDCFTVKNHTNSFQKMKLYNEARNYVKGLS